MHLRMRPPLVLIELLLVVVQDGVDAFIGFCNAGAMP